MTEVSLAACGTRSSRLPSWAWGVAGGAGLVGVYLAIVGGTSGSLGHAWELLATDWPFVAALAAGFGTQVGLYTRVRELHRASRAVAGAAGLGTGTSTAAMVACCAHHLADVVPLLSLPAVAGAAAALAQWRTPLMALGIASNLLGIGYHLRLLGRARPATQFGREVDAMAERVKDPVCGMEVDPARAAGQSEYQGRTYYFCSAHCKAAFDREPEKYVREG